MNEPVPVPPSGSPSALKRGAKDAARVEKEIGQIVRKAG